LIVVQAVSAQTTWNGLRFGASEADVRKEYQGVLQKKPTEDGRFILLDENQKLANQRAMAALHFDKSGKLNLIEVFLKDPFAAESGASATGSSFSIISVVGDHLAEKYGKPITEEGKCQLTIRDVVYNPPQEIFLCDKMWKSEGQTISLFWSIENQRLSFYGLTYKPLPSDI
jgi:hypothetical protein